MSQDLDFLQNLEVGDRVILQRHTGESVEIVARLTKTLVILCNTLRFRKADGFSPNDGSWRPICITDFTKKKHEVIVREEKIVRLSKLANYTNLSKCTDEQLHTIEGFLT